ncbi:ribonuclease P protein subunit [Candidatus Woesearchaeota archaeon]|nr:ribonuclease P protein subunit [Candidatus Woesearchaeota archaeon]
MQKVKKLIKDELIGRTVEIIGSANKSNIGMRGKVLDETKHLLFIETSKGIKKIQKKKNIFQIRYLGEKVNIKGELLFGAPAERIKTKVKNENTT